MWTTVGDPDLTEGAGGPFEKALTPVWKKEVPPKETGWIRQFCTEGT